VSTPPGTQHDDRASASVGELFADVSRDITLLLRQEVELAKAEVRQSVSRAGRGAGMLGGAGFAGYLALVFVSVALWWGLGNAIGRGWSGLVVAALWAIVAAVLAAVGRSNLRAVQGIPRTVDSAKRIPDAIKGNEEAAR
jgi:ABC-type transport system involved in cytochrome bd biosynthesis fused ATPase/permease subunit